MARISELLGAKRVEYMYSLLDRSYTLRHEAIHTLRHKPTRMDANLTSAFHWTRWERVRVKRKDIGVQRQKQCNTIQSIAEGRQVT